MRDEWTFPFGRKVKPVRPSGKGQRPVLILGVYPSALHARWVEPSGRTLVQALAVDNEPHSFWEGEDAEKHVAKVSKDVPEEAGRLESAKGDFNGSAGRALVTHYLEPLGIRRESCWITDVQDTYLANDGQINAIEKHYRPLEKEGIVPVANLRRRSGLIKGWPDRRQAKIESQFKEADPDVLITLGNEPLVLLGFDRLVPDRKRYGTPREETIFGKTVTLVPLVHTRQAGRQGTHSAAWNELHKSWQRGASKLLRL